MDKITNESLFDLKNVSQPVVAGDKVLYLETKIDKEENNYVSSIYQIDPKTKERIPYGDSGSTNTQIELSPDKKILSYLSNNTKDKKVQLFTMSLTGGAATQVTFEENGVGSYLWVDNRKRFIIKHLPNKKLKILTMKKIRRIKKTFLKNQ